MPEIISDRAMKLDETYQDNIKERKLSGMTVERINGAALKKLMFINNIDSGYICAATRIPITNIENYINGSMIVIDTIDLMKISLVLHCAPVDLVLVKGEASPVYRTPVKGNKEPQGNLNDIPNPKFISGKIYTVTKRDKQSGYHLSKKDKFIFIREAKGYGDTIHYIFKHPVGKWLITYTQNQIKSGDVTVK